MSETVNFFTKILSFCGFGCDAIDFARQDDPDAPQREQACPQFFFWAEKVLLLADIINFIFDILFIAKLRRDEQYGWSNLLLAATLTTFVGTMLIGRTILFKIKNFKPPKSTDRIVYVEASYYSTWIFIELAAFLLEDASTIYLFMCVEDNFNSSSFVDVGNLFMSLTSGIFSLIGGFVIFCFINHGPDRITAGKIFGFFGIFVLIPCIFGIQYLVVLGGDVDDTAERFSQVAVFVSNTIGYSMLLRISYMLWSHHTRKNQIEWPTDIGMIKQCDLVHDPEAGPQPHVNLVKPGQYSNPVGRLPDYQLNGGYSKKKKAVSPSIVEPTQKETTPVSSKPKPKRKCSSSNKESENADGSFPSDDKIEKAAKKLAARVGDDFPFKRVVARLSKRLNLGEHGRERLMSKKELIQNAMKEAQSMMVS